MFLLEEEPSVSFPAKSFYYNLIPLEQIDDSALHQKIADRHKTFNLFLGGEAPPSRGDLGAKHDDTASPFTDIEDGIWDSWNGVNQQLSNITPIAIVNDEVLQDDPFKQFE